MTNNPKKIDGLEGYGLSVVERRAIEIAPPRATCYLRTKRERMGHLLGTRTSEPASKVAAAAVEATTSQRSV